MKVWEIILIVVSVSLVVFAIIGISTKVAKAKEKDKKIRYKFIKDTILSPITEEERADHFTEGTTIEGVLGGRPEMDIGYVEFERNGYTYHVSTGGNSPIRRG